MSERTETSVSTVRPVEAPAGQVGVVDRDRVEDVRQRRGRRHHAQRVRRDVILALHLTARVDALHVGDVLELGQDALVDQIRELRPRKALRGERQLEDRRLLVAGALVDVRRIEIGRHVGARGIDAPLDVDRREVELRVEQELHDHDGAAVLRHRGHAVQILDAVELIFDRLDDEPFHLLRRRAGIARADHDHREGDVRVLAAAQFRVRQDAVHRERDEQHRDDDRPLNRKTRQPHIRRNRPFAGRPNVRTNLPGCFGPSS